MAPLIKNLISSSIPEVDFLVSARGIQLTSERLFTPRFIPFDVPGKCSLCKCDGVEIDFAVYQRGVFIYCPRMKGLKFVAFDIKTPLPSHCTFRVKCKGRVFNIPHTIEEEPSTSMDEPEETASQIGERLAKEKQASIEEMIQNIVKTEKKDEDDIPHPLVDEDTQHPLTF